MCSATCLQVIATPLSFTKNKVADPGITWLFWYNRMILWMGFVNLLTSSIALTNIFLFLHPKSKHTNLWKEKLDTVFITVGFQYCGC
jgi:hypothetical protein